MHFSLSLLLGTLVAGLASAAPTTKAAQFSTFAGTNAYYLPFLESDADVAATFASLKSSGVTHLRTWGFHDSTSCDSVHFQCWKNGTPHINTGKNGLQRLDAVVKAAEKYNIKLTIPFVNNWGDYGGMDVYTSQLGVGDHRAFFENDKAKKAYKNYVAAVVNRYRNSKAIWSWQLANEPRCKNCPTSVITNWAREMSAYVKQLDSKRLVSLGDEGFFNRPGNHNYPYSGVEGVDFEANLQIPTLDFGTIHMYNQPWGQTYEWGNQWILDHGAACKKAGKLCVLEEYGVPEDGATRDEWMGKWRESILKSGITGDQFWQYGMQLSSGLTHDDTYTIYPHEGNFKKLVVDWMKRRNGNQK